jgi:hypothetical protein
MGWGNVKAVCPDDATDLAAQEALGGEWDLPCIVNAKVTAEGEEHEFFFLLALDSESGETYYVIDPGPSTCREAGIKGY